MASPGVRGHRDEAHAQRARCFEEIDLWRVIVWIGPGLSRQIPILWIAIQVQAGRIDTGRPAGAHRHKDGDARCS